MKFGAVPTTVLIADDAPDYRAALVDAIAAEPRLRLVGAASDAEEAVRLARLNEPDVVLVDVRMGGGGGPRVARELRGSGIDSRVVALSAYNDGATVVDMLESGAVGYLLKGGSVEALIDGIVKAARGVRVVDEAVSSHVSRPPPEQPGPDGHETLRILLADTSQNLLETISALLRDEPDFEIVGLAADQEEAVHLGLLYRPQLAVVDWGIRGDALELVRALRERVPGASVIGLSADRDPDVVTAMLRAGANGFLVKTMQGSEMVQSLRAAARGHAAFASELAGPVIEQYVVELHRREREVDRRAAARRRIQKAIETSLAIAFQPIFKVADGTELVAVEALARFETTPRRGPAVWFREAAEVGLDFELQIAAAERALQVLGSLPSDVLLHVNLSPAAVLAGVGEALLDTPHVSRIAVEVTEHAAVADYQLFNEALAPLRENGVRLAIDDVGAGFASLHHVLALSPDMIKLDISLCRGIDSDSMRQGLAAALIGFSSAAAIDVVAEGVETPAELTTLRALGIDHAQGYLLGRPTRNAAQLEPPRT